MDERGRIVKVCGMTRLEEALALDAELVDYLGFIFYKPSPRNAFSTPAGDILTLSPRFTAVGVFVDETADYIRTICEPRGIVTVQLHGEESPAMCLELREKGYRVIKALRLDSNSDIQALTKPYAESVDIFLFDSAGRLAGGNGTKFNWELLKDYNLDIPFILSGGIGPADLPLLAQSRKSLPPGFSGWDLNSKFEVSPGHKDTKLINQFVAQLLKDEQ